MSDILTRTRDSRWPEVSYTVLTGMMMIIFGTEHWLYAALFGFSGLVGSIQFAADRICAAIRETKQ